MSDDLTDPWTGDWLAAERRALDMRIAGHTYEAIALHEGISADLAFQRVGQAIRRATIHDDLAYNADTVGPLPNPLERRIPDWGIEYNVPVWTGEQVEAYVKPLPWWVRQFNKIGLFR